MMQTDSFNHQSASSDPGIAKKFIQGMPEVDATLIIRYFAAVMLQDPKEKKKAEKQLGPYFKKLEKYSYSFIEKEIEMALKNSNHANLQKLGTKEFSKALVKTSEKIAAAVKKYYNGEIDEEKLFQQLYSSGVINVVQQYLATTDIKVLNQNDINAILNSAPAVVAYAAATAAYEELMKALAEENLAHEKMLAVRAQCDESIAMIAEYRKEMGIRVSKYLTERIETFREGFKAMDQSIIENDTNGFIQGNNQIASMLKHEIQFTTQDEFDGLMDSDVPLKL